MTVQEGYLIMFLGLGYFFFQIFRAVIYLITDKIEAYQYEKRIKNNPPRKPTIGITYYKNTKDLWNSK